MMHSTPRLLIVICTFNERENLPWIYDRLRELTDAAILIVDDNSPDGTRQWCDDIATRDEAFFTIYRPGKLGLGSATISGFQFAIANGYDLVLTMDGDRSHDPSDVPKLVGRLLESDENDLCIGSRYVPGGQILHWPLRRHVMSKAINGLSRLALGLPIRDYSSAFRCYRVPLLDRIELNQIAATGYAYLEELLWRASRHDANIVEQPIVFTNRTQGESKINLREAIRAVGIISAIGLGRLVGRS